MTNNMTSSGLWESVFLTKTDGTMGCVMSGPGAKMCGTKLLMQGHIPTQCPQRDTYRQLVADPTNKDKNYSSTHLGQLRQKEE